MSAAAEGMQTTTINRGWLTKMVVIAVVMFGFGLWGLYDALVAYPARGERAASFAQWQYLTILDAKQDGSLLTKASISDPVAEFTQLTDHIEAGFLSEEERPKYAWLQQLKLIGKLKPEYATVTDARRTLDTLKAEWSTASGKTSGANELSWYDIPAQWVIVAVGVGVGIYLIGLITVVKGTRYGWEPETQRLHLPSGATLVPSDVEVFDKRKWDKFLVYLKIKPGHPQLGGREVMLDLLRFSPLEDWILAMERTAFPETAEETPPAAPAETEPTSA